MLVLITQGIISNGFHSFMYLILLGPIYLYNKTVCVIDKYLVV